MPDPNNLLLPAQQIIFMLIPKAANTSIKHSVLRALGVKADYPRLNHAVNQALQIGRVIKVSKMQAQSMVECYKLAFVRHPYERLLSLYADKLAPGRPFHERFRDYGLTPGVTMDELVDVVCSLKDRESDQHWRSQAYELFAGCQQVPNRIWKTEELPHAWREVQLVCQRRHLFLPNLPVLNATNNARRPRLSVRQMIRLEERYADDFQLLGYEPYRGHAA